MGDVFIAYFSNHGLRGIVMGNMYLLSYKLFGVKLIRAVYAWSLPTRYRTFKDLEEVQCVKWRSFCSKVSGLIHSQVRPAFPVTVIVPVTL